MDEKSKSIWKTPWRGLRGLLLWFSLLAAAAFMLIFGVGLLVGGTRSLAESAAFCLLYAVVLAVIAVLVVALIRWLFCRRNFKRSLFALACLVTVIALFYAEENWRGKHDWQKYKREWEAKGEKFDLAAFIPPLIPDEQNLAMCPLLKPILDYSFVTNASGRHFVEKDTNGINRIIRIRTDWNSYPYSMGGSIKAFSPEQQKEIGSAKRQLDANPFTNGWINLAAWQTYYRAATNLDDIGATNSPAQDVLLALRYLEPDLAELQQEAARRPLARWHVHYETDPPAGIIVSHFTFGRQIISVLQLRSAAQLASGDSDGGFSDIQLGFRLVGSFRDEPLLTSQLIRIACYNILFQPMKEGIARHQFSEAQLAALEKELESVDLLAEYNHAMRGERAFNVGIIDWVRRQGFKFNALGLMRNMGDSESSPAISVPNLMPGGWSYQNMLTIARLHQNFTLAAVDEQNHRVFPEVSEKQDRAVINERRTKTLYNIFARILFPALSRATMITARGQTFVDETRIACALERFRLANGQLPDALDILVPRFIEKIPNDVIDGHPLRYHKTSDGGYVVYSVGWNKTDDGGKVGWTEGKHPDVDPKTGDWVWQYPTK